LQFVCSQAKLSDIEFGHRTLDSAKLFALSAIKIGFPGKPPIESAKRLAQQTKTAKTRDDRTLNLLYQFHDTPSNTESYPEVPVRPTAWTTKRVEVGRLNESVLAGTTIEIRSPFAVTIFNEPSQGSAEFNAIAGHGDHL
jgi:hypothetical protein